MDDREKLLSEETYKVYGKMIVVLVIKLSFSEFSEGQSNSET